MGIINMIKSLAREVLKEGTAEIVNKAPVLAKDGVKAVRGLIESRQKKDIDIDITEPEEKVIFENDFSAEEPQKSTPEVFVSESRLSDDVYELTRKVNALTKELQEEKNRNNDLHNEINVLKGKVSEYFGLINGLSQNISNLEVEAKKHTAQLGAINEKIRLINKRIPSKAITWIAFGFSVVGVIAAVLLYFMK